MAKKETPKAAEATSLRKITIKEVCGPTAKPTEPTNLMVVYGRTAAKKLAESANGPYIKWIGSFRAINKVTGEIFKANSLILPSDGEEMLQVLTMDSAVAEFAFNIKVTPHKRSPTGYSFVTEAVASADNEAALDRIGQSEAVQLLLSAN